MVKSDGRRVYRNGVVVIYFVYSENLMDLREDPLFVGVPSLFTILLLIGFVLSVARERSPA